MLVATLLLFVLGGSFWFVFDDLHREFMENFSQDLEISVASFRSQEEQRFKTLATIAGFLEGSPAFRNVLRRSDERTVHEYLVDVSAPTDADIVMITDAEGTLLNRSDKLGEKSVTLAGAPVIGEALEGVYAEGYWSDGESLFQIVSIPLVDSLDYVDGSLTLGTRIDHKFLLQLAGDLGVEIRYSGEPAIASTAPFGGASRYMTRELKLAPDKKLVFGKNLAPVRKFVRQSQWKLAQLGLGALLIALLVSLPLIGRMTNPVELLEIAQAEMKTIFRTNLDGLVFADERGVISTCNPAAGVALGFEEDELVGRPLVERLPPQVLEQLDDAAGGTQTANFTRQGHDFRLYRTFVRRTATETLGSILLIHDVTRERERERLFHQFLDRLDGSEQSEELVFKSGVANLKAWSRLRQDKLEKHEEALRLQSLVKALDTRFEQQAKFKPQPPPDGSVWADRELFLLTLQNLVLLCLHRFSGKINFQIETDGGAYRFLFSGELNQGAKPLGEGQWSVEEPYHSELDAEGLGLFLASRILELHHSRLAVSQQDNTETLQFSLPRSVES